MLAAAAGWGRVGWGSGGIRRPWASLWKTRPPELHMLRSSVRSPLLHSPRGPLASFPGLGLPQFQGFPVRLQEFAACFFNGLSWTHYRCSVIFKSPQVVSQGFLRLFSLVLPSQSKIFQGVCLPQCQEHPSGFPGLVSLVFVGLSPSFLFSSDALEGFS